MGVVNATPNSFSDGGKFDSSNEFCKRVRYLIESGCSYIDIGGESTAPMNELVSSASEWARLEKCLLPAFENDLFRNCTLLSIDTYKMETFERVYELWSQYDSKTQLIFNDVSGIIDDGIISFLLNKVPRALYVFCHTFNELREKSSEHMNCTKRELSGGELVGVMTKRFTQVVAEFKRASIVHRLVLDPCFGFSKTREQNLYLVDHISELVSTFSHNTWVLGISRKSFLRPEGMSLKDRPELLDQVELRQKRVVDQWQQEIKQGIMVLRIHDPKYLVSFELGEE